MNKQEQIKWILVVIIGILLTLILLQTIVYSSAFSKQEEKYKGYVNEYEGYFNELVDQLIEINRIWIKYHRGEINITNQQINQLENILDGLEDAK